MKKKAMIFGATAVILGGLVFSPKTAEAYRGDPSVQGPYCTGEQQVAMDQAFENNDYDAWVELMGGKGKVTQIITGENFAQFAEAHKLAEEGKIQEANAIRQELGLGTGSQNRNGSGQGSGQQNGRNWDI